MAGERTVYRKLQIVLDYAKEGKHRDRETLVQHILDRKPTNFAYSWRDRRTDKIKRSYSKASIARVIQLCVELKLLSGPELRLSRRGVSATDSGRFPSVVGKSVTSLLESNGLPITSIVAAIRSLLRGDPPKLPTAAEIWEQLGEPEDRITQRDFKQKLTLLGQCEVLWMTQRRIYLPK